MAKAKKTSTAKTNGKSKGSKALVKVKAKANVRKTAAKTSLKSSKNTAGVKVVEYKLFCEDSVRSLEDQVNYFIGKGWSPVGGVVLQGQSNYMQSMVRQEA